MAKLDVRKHTHIAFMLPEPGKVLPRALIIGSNLTNIERFESLLQHDCGETINVDGRVMYVVSPASIKGRKYGVAACIRNILATTAVTPFIALEVANVVDELINIRNQHLEVIANGTV